MEATKGLSGTVQWPKLGDSDSVTVWALLPFCAPHSPSQVPVFLLSTPQNGNQELTAPSMIFPVPPPSIHSAPAVSSILLPSSLTHTLWNSSDFRTYCEALDYFCFQAGTMKVPAIN